jgi:hypothetical protein
LRLLRPINLRRLALVLGVLTLCVSLGGCSLSRRKRIYFVTQAEIAAGGQPYFVAGDITYQVQISRQLNPYSTEDVQYLSGIRYAQQLPAADFWFGVFLWAKNQSGHLATTSDTFTLHDSAGDVFYPVKLNPLLNPFAWTQQTLLPNDTEPAADTTAANGPTQAGLVLFELNQTVYANRPLTLYIYPPGGSKPSLASLDL